MHFFVFSLGAAERLPNANYYYSPLWLGIREGMSTTRGENRGRGATTGRGLHGGGLQGGGLQGKRTTMRGPCYGTLSGCPTVRAGGWFMR